MSTGSSVRSAAIAALLFLGAGPAAAFDLKLWPLLDLRSRPGETHLSLLGPLVEWRSGPDGSAFDLRPVYHRESDRRGTSGTLLYPFASWERTAAGTTASLLGLLSYSRSRAPAGPTTRFRIYPFVFFDASPDRGATLSVLPFYVNLEDFLGWRRVRAILFPLTLELEDPLAVRRWLPFPFVSRVGGRTGEGWRLWPLHGWTRIGAESDTTYWLWPFYVRRTLHPGSAEEERSLVVWPLFSTIDGPRSHSRSYCFLPLFLLPLYTHSVDQRADTETWGFPWPVWLEQRELGSGRRLSLRLTPFYQARESAALRSTFVLWPFYRHRIGRGDDAGYERTDVLFFLYRDEASEREREHTRVLWPLWIEREDRRGSRAQSLTLLDGILPSNRRLESTYGPLLRLYARRAAAAEATEQEILWGFWQWGAGNSRPPWYLSLR